MCIRDSYEHDADKDWWGDLCIISNALIEKSKVSPSDIKAIGTSALGADCLPVDDQCRPLRKAILYGIDARATDEDVYKRQTPVRSEAVYVVLVGFLVYTIESVPSPYLADEFFLFSPYSSHLLNILSLMLMHFLFYFFYPNNRILEVL